MMRVSTLAAAISAALFTGCALAPAPANEDLVHQALPASTRIPSDWQAATAAGAVANDWLKSLNDPQLSAIVAEAIANNLDLRQAAEKVRAAQQTVVVVGAQFLPQLGATLGARTLNDEGPGGTGDSTAAFASIGWELDVWGRLRAQRASAEAAYEATALDYDHARQSLAATVARTWYLAIEMHQMLALAEQAVILYRKLQALVEDRRRAGKDSDLDVVDVSAKLGSAQSAVEKAREAYGDVRRVLEVLLGRYPAAEIAVAANYVPLPAMPPAGVPVALLERRPDVVAAKRVVLAAFRKTESAQLALYPDFSMSLIGGRASDLLLTLLRLNPWLASAAIGVQVPIYEGGALRAQVEIATAQQAQAVARYGSIVLRAFREVETALTNEQVLAKRMPFETQAARNRDDAVRIATVQYLAGRRDLLWVSNLQTGQLATEADLVKLRGLQQVNRITLLLALGGSFEATPAVTAGALQ
ncbi:MAG TPA: efflux transporter outer membrane subunit [Candidatus Accumulibacter phosphatis]|nr:MAG: Outer membrane protein OprM precursor [Candidatus Accumulibacter sp. SK-11]HRL75861.1 efflux transporter outer membrane subunit [Candidatus Accumulibacter phosphatis]HRQ94088.1 efflux transporter outer membrane subunit [Candidatus Accumulibacter phosphatis]